MIGVHVKDAMPKVIRGIPYGEGIVPFRETFQALVQIGFWGLIGAEMWGQMHAGPDPIEHIASARRFIQDLVTEAWQPDQLDRQQMKEENGEMY